MTAPMWQVQCVASSQTCQEYQTKHTSQQTQMKKALFMQELAHYSPQNAEHIIVLSKMDNNSILFLSQPYTCSFYGFTCMF